jgi:hypothetical protein
MVVWLTANTTQQNGISCCDIEEALERLDKAVCGAHYIIIYPDLFTLRDLYTNYIYKQIEENNGIVQINPFYETADSVKQMLSEKYNDGMDGVFKHEREKSLIITDALEEYFCNPNHMQFKKSLANYTREIGKNCFSILTDMGAIPYKCKSNDLMDYESSLPRKFDVPMKGFCIYHKKDFDRLSDEQKQKLLEHHGKTIEIVEAK